MMAAELIPKVSLRINDEFNLSWECPGCGAENETLVLAPQGETKTRQLAQKEARKIDGVQCDECCRKFEQR